MDSSSSKFDHTIIQEWAYEMATENPISPQGKFLKHQILLTLLCCANHLYDQHLTRSSEDREIDIHGVQQYCSLMKKYEDCQDLEERYADLIEPFRRLNAERLMWRYGEHLTDGAVKDDVLAVLFGAENIEDYYFSEWQNLFDWRKAEKLSSSTTVVDATEMPISKSTEMLRALTYLIRLQPSEGAYNALDRWVTLRTAMAAGEEQDDHEVDPRDLFMVGLDYEMCSELLGTELGCHANHFREAIDVFCRDVLLESKD